MRHGFYIRHALTRTQAFSIKARLSTAAFVHPLLEVPEILDVVYNPMILAIVRGYFGAEPICSFVKLRHSPINVPETMAQQWHRDSCTYTVVKAVVYLNDIDTGDGPFCYVQDTHLNATEATRRMTDEDVYEQYCDDIVYCYGAAGGVVIADTRGLHKGEVPTRTARDALILTYVLEPEPDIQYERIKIRQAQVDTLTRTQRNMISNFEVIA